MIFTEKQHSDNKIFGFVSLSLSFSNDTDKSTKNNWFITFYALQASPILKHSSNSLPYDGCMHIRVTKKRSTKYTENNTQRGGEIKKKRICGTDSMELKQKKSCIHFYLNQWLTEHSSAYLEWNENNNNNKMDIIRTVTQSLYHYHRHLSFNHKL